MTEKIDTSNISNPFMGCFVYTVYILYMPLKPAVGTIADVIAFLYTFHIVLLQLGLTLSETVGALMHCTNQLVG